MQFISTTFLCFLPIVFLLYNFTPLKYRYILLLAANYIFYGWNNLAAIPILFIATVITYIGGLVLQNKKKRLYYSFFFVTTILILVVYKYTNFIIANLNSIISFIFPTYADHNLFPAVSLVAPIGLSFFIFQSTSYLNDIYRKKMPAEKNFLRYAAFVSFFPTVLSGPIQSSRDLLPQLKEPHPISYNHARDGFLLLVWGFFEKIVVANRLAAITNTVFNDYTNYDNIYYLLAAVCYSLYIYCDFSSYSDMACGVAKILGYNIRRNFRNPYLAESLADFWNRWHMSLNNWFVENIYIPLGGNRKGKFRKYLNIFIVFFLSGIWHGASWNFIVWGAINGILRILGEIFAPVRSKLYSRLDIDETSGSIRILKKIGVFFWINITWVFFRVTDISAAFYIIKNMLIMRPVSIFNAEVFTVFGTTGGIIAFLFFVAIFLAVQYARKEEGRVSRVLSQQPEIVQYVTAALLIFACIYVASSSTTTFDTQFIYFQF